MRVVRRSAGLRLAGMVILPLALAAPVLAGDVGQDPIGDGPSLGTDIVSVSVRPSTDDVRFGVEFAGSWSEAGSDFWLLFAPGADPLCSGYGAEYVIELGAVWDAFDGDNVAGSVGFWTARDKSWSTTTSVGYSVVSSVVTVIVPLRDIGDPDVVHFGAVSAAVVDRERTGEKADHYPDPPGACRSVALSPTAPDTDAAGTPVRESLPGRVMLVLVVSAGVAAGVVAYRRLRPVT